MGGDDMEKESSERTGEGASRFKVDGGVDGVAGACGG